MNEVTGLVIVSHGDAGTAMLAEATRLLGAEATRGMEAVPVQPGEGRDAIQTRLRAAVGRVAQGRGVLVLVDLGGSTPCNCAIQLKHTGVDMEILCGLSLPMLIKAASADRTRLTPAELAHEAAQTAVRSVRLGEGGTP
jgi:PTS system mannose-specific IIA component